MRVAIYCTGFLRTFKSNIQVLKEILSKDSVKFDLYFYVVSNEYECDSYLNSNTSFDQIQTELQPKMFILEREKTNQTINERIKSMWFKLKTIDQIRRQVEERDSITYDIIIRLRPDLLILSSDIFWSTIRSLYSSKIDCIYIPSDECISYPDNFIDNYEGVNDQFAIGSVNSMSIYCMVYDNIKTFHKDKIYNSSSMLKRQLEQSSITIKYLSTIYKRVLNENKIITIAGDSGSGKTTFAKMLRTVLEKKVRVLIYECDRYHKWERGDEMWKTYTHLHPEANHIDKCQEDVRCLRSGLEIQQRDYDHYNGKFTTLESIRPCPVIIVIGLHALFNEGLNKISDCKIFLNTAHQFKEEWKIRRDKLERGYTEDQVKQQMEKRKPFFEEYIAPQAMNADYEIVYDGDEYAINDIRGSCEYICEYIISRL